MSMAGSEQYFMDKVKYKYKIHYVIDGLPSWRNGSEGLVAGQEVGVEVVFGVQYR